MLETEVKDSHPTTLGSTPLHLIEKKLPLRVLSEDDWTHWTTKGFVIVRQAVPQANVERLAKVLWEFDEKDPGDPSTWYAPQRREHKMKGHNRPRQPQSTKESQRQSRRVHTLGRGHVA